MSFNPVMPTSKMPKELKKRLEKILNHGPMEMPLGVRRYNGTGGPGNLLEDCLGVTAGSQDIADILGWEIKYCTDRTNLITLFHKEPEPSGVVKSMVKQFGWKDSLGRLSFRHTIKGQSDRFKVFYEDGNILVRPLNGEGPIPKWTHDTLLNIAGSKLRRLIVVTGRKRNRKVTFLQADVYEELQLSRLTEYLVEGKIAIDFDARERIPGSHGLRNHGVKFRVMPSDLRDLYKSHEKLKGKIM